MKPSEKPIIFNTEMVRAILEGRKRYKPKKIYTKKGEDHLSNKHIKRRLINGSVRHPKSNCWFWIRSISTMGYGQLTVDGRTRFAHRISYKLFLNKSLGELHVCHRCDNPRCINPEHLFLGTRSDNMQDASKKGRINNPIISLPGEKNPMSKLKVEDVEEIKIRCNGSETQKEIANDFGISQSQVSYINTGKRWNVQ